MIVSHHLPELAPGGRPPSSLNDCLGTTPATTLPPADRTGLASGLSVPAYPSRSGSAMLRTATLPQRPCTAAAAWAEAPCTRPAASGGGSPGNRAGTPVAALSHRASTARCRRAFDRTPHLPWPAGIAAVAVQSWHAVLAAAMMVPAAAAAAAAGAPQTTTLSSCWPAWASALHQARSARFARAWPSCTMRRGSRVCCSMQQRWWSTCVAWAWSSRCWGSCLQAASCFSAGRQRSVRLCCFTS